ncbi:hypothetical protein K5D33_17030 [Pseudomonas cichorii]|nr:hypothetical protein [Pseudomonas cichorii]MBX8520999.1 hypothetical protein [Pseudomonas cichorii]MBX8536404.1 hypothetical protein [Pseudomonas cichorii]MBX8555817.1 hypothetical protein [Pseudomonas cichorii]MBX8597628.1 hypothetical protein [Pseudomonas cichorii]
MPEAFTQFRSLLFKVNVQFVQVFSFFCSLLFSSEGALPALGMPDALARAFEENAAIWHECRSM